MLPRNGTRQPHAATVSGGSHHCSSATAPEPPSSPMVTPTVAMLLTSPRCRGGAHSLVYAIAPVYSPPTAMPCTDRSVTSSAGASTPTCS